MIETIETRVARGAALLDERLPGWVDKVDLDKLSLSNPCNCILGQTWDGPRGDDEAYWLHAEALFRKDLYSGPNRHGFNAVDPDGDEYGDLAAEWRRVILARRGGS